PPHGSVSGFQSFCSNTTFNSDGFCTAGEANGLGFGINSPGSVIFSPPLSVIDTRTSVTLGDTDSGFDGVVFSFAVAAPEPSTWALLLGGCGLAAGWSKRRRR
ncbi:MAG TPA: PEP-CTERM sorting domain-containing protein, partial [Bryobacteraceae bacterium]|nr:PEP-CTERM sorting domain-containing protein [Bryobacteraceae bacterium]